MSESASFEELETFHQELLERFTRCLVFVSGGTKEDAEDVYAESRIRAWKHFDSFDHNREYSTWRYRIIRNIWFDMYRRKKGIISVSLDTYYENSCINEEGIDILDPDVDIEFYIVEKNERMRFWEKVESLLNGHHPAFWQCVKLRFIDGLKYEEIARVLNCPSGTVRSRLCRAIKFLRSSM